MFLWMKLAMYLNIDSLCVLYMGTMEHVNLCKYDLIKKFLVWHWYDIPSNDNFLLFVILNFSFIFGCCHFSVSSPQHLWPLHVTLVAVLAILWIRIRLPCFELYVYILHRNSSARKLNWKCVHNIKGYCVLFTKNSK